MKVTPDEVGVCVKVTPDEVGVCVKVTLHDEVGLCVKVTLDEVGLCVKVTLDEVGLCVKVTLMRLVYVWRCPPRHHITSNHLLSFACRNIILTTHAQKTVLCYFLCTCVHVQVCATNVYLRTSAMVLYVIGHEYHLHTHTYSLPGGPWRDLTTGGRHGGV